MMSKEKPEGEIVTFAAKIHLPLTEALAKRLGQMTQEEVDKIEAGGEMTEQQELDLEDDLNWSGE